MHEKHVLINVYVCNTVIMTSYLHVLINVYVCNTVIMTSYLLDGKERTVDDINLTEVIECINWFRPSN